MSRLGLVGLVMIAGAPFLVAPGARAEIAGAPSAAAPRPAGEMAAPAQSWTGVPPRLVYTDGDPVPAGYHLERRKRVFSVVNGAVLAGTAYVGGIVVAWMQHLTDNATNKLFVPVLGPWFVLLSGGANGCKPSYDYVDPCSPGTTKTLLVIDGLLQAGGIAWFVFGLRGEHVLVRDRIAPVVIAPTVLGGGAYGAMLAARF